jgi:ribosomal-protein-alanine N-acetyltransferase
MRHPSSIGRPTAPMRLYGRRIMLRPLVSQDFETWSQIRQRNENWLLPWEPRRQPGFPDPASDRSAFEMRCNARSRDRSADSAYAFGLFVDQRLVGEVNLNHILRGSLQSGTIGYWIDQDHAGFGYVAEGVAVMLRFAFEQLRLHRIEICIVPRNLNSRRVVEKLRLRCEGLAERYLEINGAWEDHLRYAITAEEWPERTVDFGQRWW